MEVFNLILQQEIIDNTCFKYHHGYKGLKITHLCFADDLLVLYHSDVESAKVIKSALDKFSDVSGLYPNLGKSTIFCDSMDKGVIDYILQILPFKKEKLPVRYLGVPLVARKIVYWSSIFKLPKMVINNIEKLFKGFLWNNEDLQRRKAKVAWKEVCQPKQNGGLGLKPLESWNNALLVKHLWNVAAKKDSFWVKWVTTIKLKERSVLEVDKQANDSWIWKNLLDLRSMVRKNMMYKIGNGRKVSVWHVSWSEMPTLDSILSRREIYVVEVWSKVQVMANESDLNLETTCANFQTCLARTVFGAFVKSKLLSLKVKNSNAVKAVEEL
ncbi:hypothetical protein Tco_0267009 [Tanacetum coccineum]